LREEEIIETLKSKLGGGLKEVRVQRARRVFAVVDRGRYKEAIKALASIGLDFLEAVTGVDAGDHLEVIAHVGKDISVAVKAIVPKEDPRIDSVVDVFKGAEIYEREVWEMLGVTFEGNSQLRRVFLPEDWPKGVYPLRKEFQPG
jgi:NADH:ubiquinone oxidoreductase subunit C